MLWLIKTNPKFRIIQTKAAFAYRYATILPLVLAADVFAVAFPVYINTIILPIFVLYYMLFQGHPFLSSKI